MRFKCSAEERFKIAIESFKDNLTQAEICRTHSIYPVQLSKWREKFIQGRKSALVQRRNSDSRDYEADCSNVSSASKVILSLPFAIL
jgi:transposase-like protein